MTERIHGIIIGIVKHSDRHNVVTLYTRQRGRISVLSPAGTGRNAQLRASRLQLLSIIETDINFRAGRELPLLRNISLCEVWRDIYFNPSKQAQLFFTSEFMYRFCRESAADEMLWRYLVDALETLDTLSTRRAAMFHISFLTGLLQPAGIRPDETNWKEGSWFDMRNGEFRPTLPMHKDVIGPQEARIAERLLTIGAKGVLRLRLGREVKNSITDMLLKYYSHHYPGAGSLNSLDVLRTLF